MLRRLPSSRTLGSCVIFCAVVLAAQQARAQSFIADLSRHLIAITTAFTGTEVLLFGVVEEKGADVITLVRGPAKAAAVRQRSRVGFVWLNTREITYEDAPGYYAVAASGTLDQIGLPSELARHQIGLENVVLTPESGANLDEADAEEFREALIRNKQRERLYAPGVANVRFLGEGLFRTTLSFPANVPPGIFTVEVFQFKNGRVVAAQQSALVITKIGLEADVFDLSRERPALYGLIAVALALALGWGAGLIFRR